MPESFCALKNLSDFRIDGSRLSGKLPDFIRNWTNLTILNLVARNLSLIQEQLLHIENQQSSLFTLLQRYIGSSQSGMNCLETRLNGLEMALDEISQNVAVSIGNVSDTDSLGNTCCMLPRAEFLSPKFWRKTEGQYSSSRLSFSGRKQLAYVVSDLPKMLSQIFPRVSRRMRLIISGLVECQRIY